MYSVRSNGPKIKGGKIVAASSNFKPFFNFRYVHQVDAGLYECQINTEPKMSHFVRLKVLGKFQLRTLNFLKGQNM